MVKKKTDLKKFETDGACYQEVKDVNSGGNGVVVQAAMDDFAKPRKWKQITIKN